MALQKKLDAHKAEFRGKAPAEALAIIDRATGDLIESGLADRAAGAGDPFPDFELPGHRGNLVRSADLLAAGPLVVTVYRGVW